MIEYSPSFSKQIFATYRIFHRSGGKAHRKLCIMPNIFGNYIVKKSYRIDFF